jgi:HK97 family phage portal protein
MSFILQLLGASPGSSVDPNEERFWAALAPAAASGMSVSPETALRISAVWACVGLLAETIASLPFVMFKRLADGGRERDPSHALYRLLHNQPNAWQTAFEFREMLTAHALLRGNGYAEIVPGVSGAVEQLIPNHPDRVRVEDLPGGGFRYQVKQGDGSERPVNAEDMFHLRGLSLDGVTGLSVVAYARESMGLSLAAERYGARFFGNDTRPGGILKKEGKLSPEAAKRLKDTWESAHAGVGNSHRVAVLEEGLEWQQIGMAPEDAQFLQTREFQAEDVARWFRVPPHMIGLTSKATSWGSGIEQLSMAFVTYTLLPWLQRWQQCVSRDLITKPDEHFAEFVVDGLLRGDTKSRYGAYAVGRQWGWLSVNDIRRLENMNPIGESGDQYLRPLNMVDAADPLPEEDHES